MENHTDPDSFRAHLISYITEFYTIFAAELESCTRLGTGQEKAQPGKITGAAATLATPVPIVGPALKTAINAGYSILKAKDKELISKHLLFKTYKEECIIKGGARLFISYKEQIFDSILNSDGNRRTFCLDAVHRIFFSFLSNIKESKLCEVEGPDCIVQALVSGRSKNGLLSRTTGGIIRKGNPNLVLKNGKRIYAQELFQIFSNLYDDKNYDLKNTESGNLEFWKINEPLIEQVYRHVCELVLIPNGPKNVPKSDSELPLKKKFNFRSVTTTFSGRSATLAKLAEKWASSTELTIFAITGLGGIGKTQLALKFSMLHFSNNVVIFASGETPETFRNSIVCVAKEIKVHAEEMKTWKTCDIFLKCVQHFDKISPQWLLIVDNMDELNPEVTEFLKDLHSQEAWSRRNLILVTSRDTSATLQLAPSYSERLTVLESWEAEELVKNCLPEEDDNDVAKLCEVLQCFPLALQQAIAYIVTEQQTGLDGPAYKIPDFLQTFSRLDEKRKVLGLKLNYTHNYEYPTLVTWDASFAKIKGNSECGHEAEIILELLAFLNPDGVSLTFLESIYLSVIGDKDKNCQDNTERKSLYWKSLLLIKKYCLIETNGRSITIHRLVQEATKLGMDNTHQEEILKKLMACMVTLCDDNTVTEVDIYQALIIWKHISEIDHLVTKCSNFVGKVINKLMGFSCFRDTVAFSSSCYDALIRCKGETDGDTMIMGHRLAAAHQLNGSYDMAVPIFSSVLEKQKLHLGHGHDDTIATASNMAGCLGAMGRREEGGAQYYWVYEQLIKTHDENHPRVRQALSNHAVFVKVSPSEKRNIYLKLLEVNENVRDSPNLLVTRYNVGITFYSEGNYTEALQWWNSVLEVRNKVCPKDIETFRTRKMIAMAKHKLGQNSEAQTELEALLPEMESRLGEDHPDCEELKNAITNLSK